MMKRSSGGRPIGAKVIEVAEVAARLGPCTAEAVRSELPGVGMAQVLKYMRRAVTYGLMTCDDSEFEVVQNWRGLLRRRHEAVAKARPTVSARLGVSFVFDLGRA